MRGGPARRARDEAQPLLQIEPVHLVDHAVDIVAEAGALCVEGGEGGLRLRRVGAAAVAGIGGEVPGLDLAEEAVVAVPRLGGNLAPGVAEHLERTGGGDLDVLLPQRSGGGVARVGEDLVARLRLAAVQLGEARLFHEHLAADLEHRGRVGGQGLGQVGDGRQVGGDVLAFRAVASGHAAHQLAVFVARRERQAVDLRLGHQHERLVGREPQEAPHAVEEFGEVVVGEGVVEGEHRHRVPDLAEALRRRRADPLRRAVVADQLGEARLDRGVAAAQGVVYGVVDLGVVVAVIGVVRRPDPGSETGEFRRRVLGRQIRDPNVVGHRCPSSNAAAARRASSVSLAPDSIRAISSKRASASRVSTVVEMASTPSFFTIR